MSDEKWTATLTEIHREDDGERIGYIRPDSGGLWEPLNLLGLPLREWVDRETAERTVREIGMSSLLGALWCKIPRPLTQSVTDARQTEHESWWERMAVVELNSGRATIRPYYPMEEEQGRVVVVNLPADDVIFTEPPEDI